MLQRLLLLITEQISAWTRHYRLASSWLNTTVFGGAGRVRAD